MDDPNEENIEANWVILNPVDIAEEAVEIADTAPSNNKKIVEETNENLLNIDKGEILSESGENSVESDIDSDGISVISESSHIHDNVEEEHTIDLKKANDQERREVTEDSHIEIFPMKNANNFKDEGYPEGSAQSVVEKNSPENKDEVEQQRIEELAEQLLDRTLEPNVNLTNELEQEQSLVKEIKTESPNLVSKIPAFKKYLNGFVIGTILLATSSVFLGRYFNTTDELENFPQYPDKYDIVENVHDDGSYEVPTALAYCTEKHKNDRLYDGQNVQKCLRKIENRMKRKKENNLMKQDMENLQKQLKIKENFLIEKEKYLARKEYELNTKEIKMRRKTKEAVFETSNTENTESETNSDSDVTNFELDSEKKQFLKSEPQYREEIDVPKTGKDKKNYHDDRHDTEKKYKKSKKDKSKLDVYKYGKYLYDDEQNDEYHQHKAKEVSYRREKFRQLKKQILKYEENENDADRDSDDDYDDYKYRNRYFRQDSAKYKKNKDDGKSTDHKKIKDCSSQEKHEKESDGFIKKEKHRKWKSPDRENRFCSDFSETDAKKSNYKYYNSCKEDRKDKKFDAANYVLINNKNDSNSMNGYWVGKLFKGRSDLRNKDNSGEWYFDRASYRKKKRDKAKWYFDWMMDREVMRYKRSFGGNI